MMKITMSRLLTALLVSSLAANAYLGWRRFSSPPSVSVVPALPATTSPEAIRAAETAALGILKTEDLTALRDQLRAAGLDDALVREIVTAKLREKYEASFKALRPDPASVAWWRTSPYGTGQTPEQSAEARRLEQQIRGEMRQLLGSDTPMLFSEEYTARYNFLPANKRQLILQIENDFNQLRSDILRDAMGTTLPGDREKRRLLDQEKRRDLAAVLTADEVLEYDLRFSNTAVQMRWQLLAMQPTEAEFRAIFPLRQAFDEKWRTDLLMDMDPTQLSALNRERSEARKLLSREIVAAIGPERGQTYVLSQNDPTMVAAVSRFNLPPETTGSFLQLRASIGQRGMAVVDNPALSNDQKRAELKNLAQEARGKIETLLGAPVVQALGNQTFLWVTSLDQGVATSYDPVTQQPQSRSIGGPPRAPSPGAPTPGPGG
ncbi:MAG: hypothetical protein A3G75_02310 [Verrucomicrobia bacterium RIFCSPLOWO2_12_FULL_64_8]|nr:MAG: hypothetical protein A3G75_02310 [Verrucomicrobia bacterium RIFCSPLOWO2_12_FULL_64_8]